MKMDQDSRWEIAVAGGWWLSTVAGIACGCGAKYLAAAAINRAPRRNTNNEHHVQFPELPRLSQATALALNKFPTSSEQLTYYKTLNLHLYACDCKMQLEAVRTAQLPRES